MIRRRLSTLNRPGPSGRALAALAAVVVGALTGLGAVLAFWAPGYLVTSELDIGDVQTGVRRILTDDVTGYGAANVKSVSCNDGRNPVVQPGSTFTCVATVDGTIRLVTVTIDDKHGNYEVGRPH